MGPAAAGLTLRLTGFVSFTGFVVQRFAGPTLHLLSVERDLIGACANRRPSLSCPTVCWRVLPHPFSNNEKDNMTIVADHPRTVHQREVTGGVDTHADFHVAAGSTRWDATWPMRRSRPHPPAIGR